MQEQPDQTGLTLGLRKMTALIHMTGFPVNSSINCSVFCFDIENYSELFT